jgi:Mg2+-importing ATPase
MVAALLEASDRSIEDLLASLNTTSEGLSEDEAAERLQQFGPNEVPTRTELTLARRLYRAFINPFNVVLLVLAGVSALTDIVLARAEERDPWSVVIILTMVSASGLLRFVQEKRSDEAARKLQRLVGLTAAVQRRESGVRERPVAEIVPGDLVHLAAGDMIPADVRIVRAKDLFVSQSVLTGESEPVEKLPTLGQGTVGSTAANPMDRHNLAFMGSNVVSGSGVGVVVATGGRTYYGSIARSLTTRREATSFELGVSQISWVLIRFMLAMVPIVFLLNVATKGVWLESLLFALAVAVGLTPEMLPMIVTAGLAKGAVFMARKKVIVKNLSAMQNFGTMDVLCADKTGTLTRDEIVLEFYMDVHGRETPRVLRHAYINSYFQTGLRNALDRAILAHAGEEFAWIQQNYEKVDEIPFDFTRKRMSVVVRDRNGKTQLVTKGAVEEMLTICSYVDEGDRVVPLTPQLEQEILTTVREFNAKGLRVLAVAQKTDPPAEGQFSVADERDMVLLGFLAFLDPPKETAADAIRALQEHGIALKILTGDNDAVARAIADKVGLETRGLLLGSDVDAMDDATLQRAVEAAPSSLNCLPNRRRGSCRRYAATATL